MNRIKAPAFWMVVLAFLAAASSHAAPGDNVAAGRSYEFSIAPNYPLCTEDGDARDLTDGIHVASPQGSAIWGQKGCVGWQHTRAPVAITVDLGEVLPIGGASIRCAANAAGVSFPSSILLQVSDDGKNFVTVGDLIRLSQTPAHPSYNVYAEHTFKTESLYARGRFVRFNLVPSSIFLFTDEIEIHRGDDSMLAAPLEGKVLPDADVVDPLRLTQLGVYRRLRSDLEQVQSLVSSELSDPIRSQLLEEISRLGRQLSVQTWPDRLDGFRAALPLNDLHRAIFAVHGKLLAAKGIEPLSVWHSDPYELLGLLERPRGQISPLSVRMLLNEHRPQVINLTNASGGPRTAQVRLEGIPGEVVRVFQVEYVDTREYTPVAGALVELSANDGFCQTIVPAGMTRQIWLSFHPTQRAHAGVHSGRILLKSEAFAQAIELNLSVSSLSLPQQPSCAMGLWDYITDLNYDITEANAQSSRQSMETHLAHNPWCGPNSVPMPTAQSIDAQGNLIGTIDYTQWDKFVKLWPGARQYMAFAGLHHDSTLVGHAAGTPQFQRLVQQWAADWARHNRDVLKLEPGRVMLLPLDEPALPEHFLATARFAEPFREGTRDILLFVDPVGTAAHQTEHARRALELADVVSPLLRDYVTGPAALRGFYQELRGDGRQIWFYMCSGPVRHFDPGYYRLQPWHAFAAGGNGSQFWAFGDAGAADGWNEYTAIGRQNFSPVYLSPTSVTTSKHWEAAREGVQDFDYLTLLQARIDQLDPARAEKARQLLSQACGDTFHQRVAEYDRAHPEVFNNASSIAESFRLQILDLLEPSQ